MSYYFLQMDDDKGGICLRPFLKVTARVALCDPEDYQRTRNRKTDRPQLSMCINTYSNLFNMYFLLF